MNDTETRGQKKFSITISKPIVLIGMMGTGKSHMGRMLSRHLGIPFYDTDKIIEEKAGCAIAEIFDRFGEKKFREVEAKTIQNLLEKKACVIATGGGAVENHKTLTAILEKGSCIWVKSDFENILKRVRRNENRPLLKNGNPEEILKELMERRKHLYAQAPFSFQSQEEDLDQNIEKLIQQLSDQGKGDTL